MKYIGNNARKNKKKTCFGIFKVNLVRNCFKYFSALIHQYATKDLLIHVEDYSSDYKSYIRKK